MSGPPPFLRRSAHTDTVTANVVNTNMATVDELSSAHAEVASLAVQNTVANVMYVANLFTGGDAYIGGNLIVKGDIIAVSDIQFIDPLFALGNVAMQNQYIGLFSTAPTGNAVLAWNPDTKIYEAVTTTSSGRGNVAIDAYADMVIGNLRAHGLIANAATLGRTTTRTVAAQADGNLVYLANVHAWSDGADAALATLDADGFRTTGPITATTVSASTLNGNVSAGNVYGFLHNATLAASSLAGALAQHHLPSSLAAAVTADNIDRTGAAYR